MTDGRPAYPAVAVWSTWTRQAASVLLILFTLWLVYLGRSVIQMLIVAAILAFMVQPFVIRLEARGWRRSMAVTAVYLAVVGAGLVVLAVVVPQVAGELQALTANSIVFLQTGQARVEALLLGWRTVSFAGVSLDLSRLVDPVLADLGSARIPPELLPSAERLLGSAQAVVRTASGLVVGLSGLVFTLFLTLFFALRMSLEGARLLAAVADYAGESHSAEYRILARRVKRAWSGFFRGQLQLSLIIGVAVWLGASLLGLPGALVLGILSGLLEVLPNIGPVLATVPAVAVALIEGSTHLPVSNATFAVIVLIFYIVVQQAENAIVVPRVIGGAVDLPALVVMVAVVVGAEVGGVLGAFVAAPLVATIREVVVYSVAKIRGVDPYPELRPPIPPPQVATGG